MERGVGLGFRAGCYTLLHTPPVALLVVVAAVAVVDESRENTVNFQNENSW